MIEGPALLRLLATRRAQSSPNPAPGARAPRSRAGHRTIVPLLRIVERKNDGILTRYHARATSMVHAALFIH
jgi:hypothetical protein